MVSFFVYCFINVIIATVVEEEDISRLLSLLLSLLILPKERRYRGYLHLYFFLFITCCNLTLTCIIIHHCLLPLRHISFSSFYYQYTYNDISTYLHPPAPVIAYDVRIFPSHIIRHQSPLGIEPPSP